MARPPRFDRGQRAYFAGLSAEEAAMRAYEMCGFETLAKRWRGASGEIDLILRSQHQLVFAEIKQSKTHAQAAQHLSAAQQARIYQAAEEYLAAYHDLQECDMRFDAVLVDGQGEIEILENAFGFD